MRLLKLPEDYRKTLLSKALELATKAVEGYTGTEPSLNFSLKPELDVKADLPIVYITTKAYLKMFALVGKADKELAWHGLAERVDNDYIITDVLVYPQTVTAATVDSDEVEYAKWCMNLDDDTINKLRFQGHSHVHMATSPSGRDTQNWEDFFNLVPKDGFYIFCIFNKRGESHWRIYDKKKNIMFEDKDIKYVVIDEQGNDIYAWADDSIKEYIKTVSPYTPSTTKTTHIKYNTYDYIPKGLKEKYPNVEYYPEVDMYMSEEYFKGSIYNNAYMAWAMSGADARKTYGTPTVPKEKKRGRPSKKKGESK